MTTPTDAGTRNPAHPTMSRPAPPKACSGPTRSSDCARRIFHRRRADRRAGAPQPALMFGEDGVLARMLRLARSRRGACDAAGADKRFADPAWRDNPLYRLSLQGYLAWRNALADFVDARRWTTGARSARNS